MNSHLPSSADGPPAYGDEADLHYTIEVIAELAGVDSGTVLYYQEQGFLHPVRRGTAGAALFDTESLRRLRRIEHLRATCGVNDTGLKLMLKLLEEVEQLRGERRQRTR